MSQPIADYRVIESIGDVPRTLATDPLRAPMHSGHVLATALHQHRDRNVLHLGDITLTGAELAARTSQYAQALESLGAADASALLALNRPEVLILMCAGTVNGFRRVALHPLSSADDQAYVINDAGLTSLIIDPFYADRAIELLGKCPGLKRVLTLGPVPEVLAGVGVDLPSAAGAFDPLPLTPAPLAADNLSALTYTGGTTGRPKGVIGTSGAVHAMLSVQLMEWEWPDNPRFLLCTPLSHAGGAFFAPTVVRGGTLFVVPKFDPGEVLRSIEEHRISATMLVPAMLYALLDHPDSHTRDLSSLQTVFYGASAINPVRLKEAIDRFGPVFAQFYGQSEAPMVITYLSRRDHVSSNDLRLTSCGRPSPFVRSALLDENGKPVPPGQPGEICVSGPLVTAGYWHRPEETAETYRDGWLHTGDVAREDEDGFWYIVDRTKDMIVTGGYNVYPREVEDVLAEHPMIAQAAVIGIPHEKFGEAVTAFVVLRQDAATDEAAVAQMTKEVQDLVKARKGAAHSPKSVTIVDALPLTGLGKPDKKALRAPFWSGDRGIG